MGDFVLSLNEICIGNGCALALPASCVLVVVGEGIQGRTWEARGLAEVSKILRSEID